MLPQVEEVLQAFPRIQTGMVNAAKVKEIAGYLSVFTVPVLILYADGSEVLREARIVHIDEFQHKIKRVYEGYYPEEES